MRKVDSPGGRKEEAYGEQKDDDCPYAADKRESGGERPQGYSKATMISIVPTRFEAL